MDTLPSLNLCYIMNPIFSIKDWNKILDDWGHQNPNNNCAHYI